MKTLSLEDDGRNAPRCGAEKRGEEIAQELGVSRQRIDAILKRSIGKIRVALEKRGIRSTDDLIP